MALTISIMELFRQFSYHLEKANVFHCLPQGRRLKWTIGPRHLLVAMKVSSDRLTGAQNNIWTIASQKSRWTAWDSRIVMRMSELKGTPPRPLKSDSDVASYNNEFKDLWYNSTRYPRWILTSFFADMTNSKTQDRRITFEAIFGAENTHHQFDHLDIYTSSEGLRVQKCIQIFTLSALTLKQNGDIAGDPAADAQANVAAGNIGRLELGVR